MNEVMDLRGKPCPIPVIEVKKALASVPAGKTLSVLVDNDVARQNLQKLAEGLGHVFSHEQSENGDVLIHMTLNEACASMQEDDGSGLVVAIGADQMGRGDDELGRMLMKSFLFSLTELATPPAHVLFFNGGVHLTCDGSAALKDLSALSEKGTFVNSCGACLNFYGKTDAVRVGGITNMFAILETMAQAKRLIAL